MWEYIVLERNHDIDGRKSNTWYSAVNGNLWSELQKESHNMYSLPELLRFFSKRGFTIISLSDYMVILGRWIPAGVEVLAELKTS